jgi:hypothetical protein
MVLLIAIFIDNKVFFFQVIDVTPRLSWTVTAKVTAMTSGYKLAFSTLTTWPSFLTKSNQGDKTETRAMPGP